MIWIVFNAIFVPVRAFLFFSLYLLKKFPHVKLIWLVYPETANRQLEDIDALYREDRSMIWVFRNKDAIQVERPQRFIDADRERIEMVHRQQQQQQQHTENQKEEKDD